jgi:hypothetical protein
MLKLFIGPVSIQMSEGQELAVKDLLKECIAKGTLKSDTIVSVCDEKNEEIESIKLNVLFDL